MNGDISDKLKSVLADPDMEIGRASCRERV